MSIGIFGNATAERVLLFMGRYNEGYAQGIADNFSLPISQVQRQLQRFEASGVLVSQLKGRTRVFLWNPRCYFLEELKELLSKIHGHLPPSEREKYFMKRVRPRRTGKLL